MTNVTHALCNAHILGELKAPREIEKEPWARAMQRLLRLGGAQTFCTLRGFLSTAQKQGLSPYTALTKTLACTPLNKRDLRSYGTAR